MSGMASRRRFLSHLGRGTAVAALFPAIDVSALAGALPSLPPRGSDAQDEEYWKLVRARFPLRRDIVPMNAANLCPAPRSVIDATVSAAADIDGDVSFQNRAKYDAMLETLRTRLAAYLGAEPGEIAIVRNTSEANNTIAAGLSLGANDEVLLSDLNHPTNNIVWDVRAKRYGFTVRRVSIPATPPGANEIVDAFESAISPRTRVLSFTDVSNSTGVRMPARELCMLARARGIHAHVDGAQTFGALQRNLHELGCDSYAASAHKWLMGPKEAGVLFVRTERASAIWPLSVGVGWGNQAETGLEGARRFETLGQRDDAVFAGFLAALDFHDSIGPAKVEARTLALTTALRERLAGLDGVTPVISADPALRAGVCIVRVDGVQPAALHERLYERHGIAGAPTGGLRLSPHVYNTMADIDAAAGAIREEIVALRG